MLLSTKLNQRAKMLVAAGALAAVALAALPGAAEAQQEEGAQSAKPSAEPATPLQAMPEPAKQAVVVNPGDSLWSIAQRELGPNATPQQIATEVERTFELNRERIGDDPNLILAGQELMLSPVSEPTVTEPATNTVAVGEPATGEPAADALADEAAEPAASESTVGASTGKPAEPSATQTAKNKPAIDAPLNIPVTSWLDERRLLGLGSIVLTLILAMLILWKAPLRRDVGSGAWRMPAAGKHPTNYSTSQLAPTAASARRWAFALSGSENGSGRFGNEALTNGRISNDERRRRDRENNHATFAKALVGRRRKNPLRSRASLSRRPLSGGGAAAVYSPQVRHSLEHAIRTETQSAGAR